VDYEEFSKIEEQCGVESVEAKEAYLELIITDLKPITARVDTDDWGDTIITCNERNDITTAELLEFITFFQGAECAIFTIKGNKIKISPY